WNWNVPLGGPSTALKKLEEAKEAAAESGLRQIGRIKRWLIIMMVIIEEDLNGTEEKSELTESPCKEMKTTPPKNTNMRKRKKIHTDQLEVAETVHFERSVAKLEKIIDELQDKLKCSKEKHLYKQKMLDRILLDLNK
ncbi:Tropomyosin alpha-3 chain, partial [Galemys pyrenaicus]